MNPIRLLFWARNKWILWDQICGPNCDNSLRQFNELQLLGDWNFRSSEREVLAELESELTYIEQTRIYCPCRLIHMVQRPFKNLWCASTSQRTYLAVVQAWWRGWFQLLNWWWWRRKTTILSLFRLQELWANIGEEPKTFTTENNFLNELTRLRLCKRFPCNFNQDDA